MNRREADGRAGLHLSGEFGPFQALTALTDAQRRGLDAATQVVSGFVDLFDIQPGKDGGVVGNQTLLAEDILTQLREPTRQLVTTALNAAGILFKLRAGNPKALEDRGGF